MSEPSTRRLPVLRLAGYVLVCGLCGAVASHEVYYALASNTTTATVLALGATPNAGRSARYWVEYAYFDTQRARHVGRAEGVYPSMRPGDGIGVEYLRHAPQTSRLTPSPALGLGYGAAALLAALLFAAEIVTWRRGQRRGDAALH
jgi:hypothetical protein